jgi:hypothetical protein
MKSVINSYRLQPGPPSATGTIAGRIVPVVTRPDYRRALLVLAALLLPLLAVGVVVYAARTLSDTPAPVVLATVAPTLTPVVIVQERVVQVQVEAPPVVIVVTATPIPSSGQWSVVSGQTQAAPARVSNPLPPPTAPPRQVAPAPQPVTQAYGCVGLGPCAPPSAPPQTFAGYRCADGRFFSANGPWGMFGVGTWIAEPKGGDVFDIRDTTDPNRQTMGWHTNCRKVWR